MFQRLRPALPQQLRFADTLPAGRSYAPHPVWKDSTTQPVRFRSMSRKVAARLYHDARRFDRQTHQPGKHGGAVGRPALQVLHALLFDFLNHATGRLDPGYEAIARMANVSRATAARALVRLRELGMLNWIRRSLASMKDGRFVLDQDTNAYAVLPASQWRGYRPPAPPPAPAAGTWGDHPPLLDAVAQAVEDRRLGGSPEAQIAALESDPNDAQAVILARIGRLIAERDAREAAAKAAVNG